MDLTPPELLTEAAKCLLSIHVITGWVLPDDKDYVKELTNEFRLKLAEDFETLNFHEVKYAFRRAAGKKDWGKNMNLALLSEVLAEYSDDRRRASAEEERLNSKPPVQKIYSDEQLENLQRMDIENFYQRCRAGIVPTNIPGYFLPMLIKDGFMAEGSDDMAAFFSDKLNKGIEQLYHDEATA